MVKDLLRWLNAGGANGANGSDVASPARQFATRSLVLILCLSMLGCSTIRTVVAAVKSSPASQDPKATVSVTLEDGGKEELHPVMRGLYKRRRLTLAQQPISIPVSTIRSVHIPETDWPKTIALAGLIMVAVGALIADDVTKDLPFKGK
jgi:uncharacterized protein YceK